MKAVAYYRRSTDRQETSIEQQREAVEAFARQNKIEIVREYVDTGSGKSVVDRAQFLRLIEDGKSRYRDFTAVLVYDISRFGRMEADEIGYYRHQLKANGVSIIYVAEGLRNDGSMGDRIVKGVKQEMAHEYSRDVAQKIIRGLISHTEKGFASGRLASYGYVLMEVTPDGAPVMEHDEKGNLIPRILRHEKKERKANKNNSVKLTPGDPMEAGVVKRIFQMADGGAGVHKICETLNREGVPSPGKWKRVKGTNETRFERGRWSSHIIWTILRNPVYKGTLIWGRTRNVFREKFEWTRDNGNIVIGEKRRRNSDIQRMRDEKEWVRCENAHKAIIDPEFFDRLQVKLGKRPMSKRRAGNASKHLLTGYFFCGDCGERMRAEVETRRATIVIDKRGPREYRRSERKYRYYRCSGFADKRVCKPNMRTYMDIVDPAVWGGIQRRLGAREALVSKIVERVKAIAEEQLGRRPKRLQEIEADRREITVKIDRLLDLAESGEDTSLIKDRLESHRVRLRELEIEKSEFGGYNVDLALFEREADRGLRNLDRLAERGSAKERREVVGAFVDRAVADWKARRLDVFYYTVPGLEFSEIGETPTPAMILRSRVPKKQR